MKDSNDLRQENEALRERIFTLNAAILRTSATLALDTTSHSANLSSDGAWTGRPVRPMRLDPMGVEHETVRGRSVQR